MGLLDRLRQLDDNPHTLLDEPVEVDPANRELMDAILGVLIPYLDAAPGPGPMLFAIARRELAAADLQRLQWVVIGIVEAADKLRPHLPPGYPTEATG